MQKPKPLWHTGNMLPCQQLQVSTKNGRQGRGRSQPSTSQQHPQGRTNVKQARDNRPGHGSQQICPAQECSHPHSNGMQIHQACILQDNWLATCRQVSKASQLICPAHECSNHWPSTRTPWLHQACQHNTKGSAQRGMPSAETHVKALDWVAE